MSGQQLTAVGLRPWSDGDLALLERLMGDPAMTEHLGGPESPEKIRERHQRYCQGTGEGGMFVIEAGPGNAAAGSIGYWKKVWRGQPVWESGWSVLPEFQGQGVATRATSAVVAAARAEGKYRFIHAFPSVDNGPSNAICRKAGFTLQEAVEFEYPPGRFMRCNDWRLDLFAGASEANLVGAWKLVSFESRKDNGEVTYPFGKDAQGSIIYTATGRFAVQLLRGTRPRFVSADQMKGTAEEIKAGFEGCIAYYGSYDFQLDGGFVVHHVEGSLFPNWEGPDLKRFVELSGDRLQLKTPPTLWGGGGEIVGVLEWERVG